MENLRPLRTELPAVWSGISNAMRGYTNLSLHMLVLVEVLGMELSNFSQQLKLKPGVDDDHRVIGAMSIDLWFRGMELKEEGERRKNSKETRAHEIERLACGKGSEGALASSARSEQRTTASTGAVCTDTRNLL